ncbi:MAG: hypothetical protein JWN77_1345 [Frankiales bacterium]|nr:hypothetical protein [Frankiales bacterium]
MSTAAALQALGRPSTPSVTSRISDGVTGWLAKRTSRRGFLVRAGVVGSAFAVDTVGFALKPGTAYAAVCGPGASCASGWTVFCATINDGVNACPPGSIAAGWWKADGASLCGGKARYIVDCNATCSRCSGGGASGICAKSCWSCSCRCGPTTGCDQRKNCCNAFRYGQCHTEVAQVGGVQCRVVSCTPPWKWEKCSTAPATDNNTRDHTSGQLPAAFTPITQRYIAMGENGSVLGASVYGELAVAGGRAQQYQRGRISQSAATGVHETVAAIAARYVELGAEAGPLGFPATGNVVQAGGAVTRFQNGRISWHPSLGAYVTRGALAVSYAHFGGEAGVLGFPTSDQAEVAGGTGVAVPTQRGRVSLRTGGAAYPVHDVLAEAYDRAGNEDGPLGFPTGEEVAVAGGRAQVFEHGRISSSEATGAHWLSRRLAEKYVELGAESSSLGFPTGDEHEEREWPWRSAAARTVRLVTFERGAMTWNGVDDEVTVVSR